MVDVYKILPKLAELLLPNGSHANWTLTDDITGDILWQEWNDDSLGKMWYNFKNDKQIFIPNPNRKANG